LGKDTDHRTATLEFFIQTFQGIGRVDLAPMLDVDVVERQDLALGVLDQLHNRREARRQDVAYMAQLRCGS
jgi:hypothetical protein